ncbi:glycosyltransferase [Polynucleobacter sp. AP-Nickl1-40-C4]|uniref:glycosyltransferase n=1 Tax=Polynucleobacter sp. AP-Nickl1-40-C4 TaxID=3108275 RepID=UPI002B222FFB|nr:glycosyltransferase [Polynucleobacter sp. AP-Nickl1-40-C4]MEA9568019.1 glycosyltransferase [Polynucleobacter sp. AP-Nickl1-40-C4]
MKILHISGDINGGAFRATERLHNAIKLHTQSKILVRESLDKNSEIIECRVSKFKKNYIRIINSLIGRAQRSSINTPRSINYVGHLKAAIINRYAVDIVSINWIGAGFLSIKELSKINKPVIFTLHDMWGFCGAEHLSAAGNKARWMNEYSAQSRGRSDFGLDVDGWVWKTKKKYWKNRFYIVAPSKWMSECANSSSLMAGWDITTIPNGLDLEVFKPEDRMDARARLSLPLNIPLVLFGAVNGVELHYKGWDLLEPAILALQKKNIQFEVVIFGQKESRKDILPGIKIHWFGEIRDDKVLASIYCAANVMVVPSRQESFCQTASEAQACGCPVVAFNATGLKDVVEHNITGYLAEPFKSTELAAGIEFVLGDKERAKKLSSNARIRAELNWSYEIVAEKYLALCTRILQESKIRANEGEN